jgi:hypothetical protein
VVGPAKYRLVTPDAADPLRRRGIIWAPDHVASADGIVNAIGRGDSRHRHYRGRTPTRPGRRCGAGHRSGWSSHLFAPEERRDGRRRRRHRACGVRPCRLRRARPLGQPRGQSALARIAGERAWARRCSPAPRRPLPSVRRTTPCRRRADARRRPDAMVGGFTLQYATVAVTVAQTVRTACTEQKVRTARTVRTEGRA